MFKHLSGSIRYRSLIRLYSTHGEPPRYSKKGNFIINALNYVNQVDHYQTNLVKNSSINEKSNELMKQIANKKESLYLLSLFHFELSKIGINNKTPPNERDSISLKYKFWYLLKFAKIHNIFWETCRFQNISQHNHTLGFSPNNIGILDPWNFNDETYQQLQSGKLGDIVFKNIEIVSFSKPPFKETSSE